MAGSLKRPTQELNALLDDAFTTGTIRRRSYKLVPGKRDLIANQ